MTKPQRRLGLLYFIQLTKAEPSGSAFPYAFPALRRNMASPAIMRLYLPSCRARDSKSKSEAKRS